MPLLSDYARRKKSTCFLAPIPKDARILEIGCGSGWVGEYLRRNGREGYVGLDVIPPADYVGNIKEWRALGLQPESFDVIIAFEVVEHIDCLRECYDLLKHEGELLLTSPVPRADWILQALEWVGLNQKRTTPHDHLVYFQGVPLFEEKEVSKVAKLSQWGRFRKSPPPGRCATCSK